MSLNGEPVHITKRRERFASRELLFNEPPDGSGDDVEGHHQQKHRWGLQHHAFMDGSTQMLDMDDSLHLPDQIAEYNRKKSQEYRLLLCEVRRCIQVGAFTYEIQVQGCFWSVCWARLIVDLCSQG